ncbi:MAG: proprotein convertase P-domain-containing protein [Saprospiraceae bacterium]
MAFIIKQRVINSVIPDNDDNGLQDTIKVFKKGTVSSLSVRVNITHSYSGDLEISLTAPSGKSAVLHARAGGSKDNIELVFDGDAVSDFVGEKAKGKWTLTTKDFAPRDEGTLNNWSLRIDCTDKSSEIYIPEGEGKSLISKQTCTEAGTIKGIEASIDIEHSYVGDLVVTLKGPDASVILHDRESGSKKNLKKSYKKALSAFIGTKAKGEWVLEVADYAPRDSGRIKSWNVDLSL